jgi:short-subunit dehydrogenase
MFADKVVWITGASSGIGEALAIEFAREKALLILSARRVNELERVKSECLKFTDKVSILPVDLSELTALNPIAEKAISLFGRIDILVNNGGISQRSLAAETDFEVEKLIMDINFFSAVILTKAVLPIMKKKGAGNIVVISSLSGKFGVPMRSAYAASKHALIGYFDSLRAETVNQNICIHIICPGYIRTDISRHAVTANGKQQGIMDKAQAQGMPAEKCAKQIISAIKKNKKEVLVGNKEILMAYIRRFFPQLYYKMIIKVNTK